MNPQPHGELSISALRAKTREPVGPDPRLAAALAPAPLTRADGTGNGQAHGSPSPAAAPAGADLWPFVEAVVRGWPWLLIAALGLGLLGWWAGQQLWQTRYTATAQLVRVDPNPSGEYRPRELTAQSFASLVGSPELRQRVSELANPPISPAELAASTQIRVDREDQSVAIAVRRADPVSAVALANLSASEAVKLNQRLQAREQIAAQRRRLQSELTTLLARYTEAHPAVQQQRARLAALAMPLLEQAESNYHLFAPATAGSVEADEALPKIGLLAVFGAMLGLTAVMVVCLGRELLDNRLKSASELQRLTALPVLATLGNLQRMSPEERAQWGFCAWKSLLCQLGGRDGQEVVCGFTATSQGEGRTAILSLLTQAACRDGRRVLQIALKPRAASQAGNANLPADVLAAPKRITEILLQADPNAFTSVAVALRDEAWDAERYQRWRLALRDWQRIERVAIFVELPAAAMPETVLLAESLPHVIWVADARRAQAERTQADLATLRHAGCQLAGAILNRARTRTLQQRFARWAGMLLVAALGGPWAAVPVEAQTSDVMVAPAPRLPWQENLTIGPGDVLRVTFHDQTEPIQREVLVGPDGRVSFLEAQDLPAAGLTIDQLRGRLDEELGRFRRAARTTVNPVAYRSKKYFVLGAVAQNGVFTLDRPIRIIEAVARARGLETGLVEQEMVELVDLSRSFLAREGRRLSVDLERLFREGDFSQNVALAPGDYLYFSPAQAEEIYVLGAVADPGVLAFSRGVTAVGAVAGRGGFAPRAWSRRVLVVRGGLNRPEKFVIDVPAVLAAQATDLALQPGDIVYVAERPWARAEELLDAAASSFVESAVTTWSGVRVGSAVRNGVP